MSPADNVSKNSIPNPNTNVKDNVKKSNRDISVEKYSETQYNNFGWVRYNDVLSAAEYGTLLSRYADYKHNKNIYPTTRFGEAVIHSTEWPNVIMYVKGSIRSPQITKVVKIEHEENWAIPFIKEEILSNEHEQDVQPFKTVEDYFGYGVLDIVKARDYASFRQYLAEQERNGSQESNTVSGEQHNGTGSIGQGEKVDSGRGIKLSDRDIDAEISSEDYSKLLSKKAINVSKEIKSKISKQRFSRYADVSEEEIPRVDVFRIADYSKVNVAYKYIVRNEGKDFFTVIKKQQIKPNNVDNSLNKTIQEAIDNARADKRTSRTQYGRYNNQISDNVFGDRRQLQENDTLVKGSEESDQERYNDESISNIRRGVKHSDRDPEAITNRGLLADALVSVAKNDNEVKMLVNYKSNIELMYSQQERLDELNRQIKELSFAKGKRDTNKLQKLKDEAIKTANRINLYDKELLKLEATKPLRDLLKREKDIAIKKQKQKDTEKAVVARYFALLVLSTAVGGARKICTAKFIGNLMKKHPKKSGVF